jgi:hypothetical protein
MRGRPATGKGEGVLVRLQPSDMVKLDTAASPARHDGDGYRDRAEGEGDVTTVLPGAYYTIENRWPADTSFPRRKI